VEQRFSGPAYTLGIEEELMIVDAESLELVNALEAMLEPASVVRSSPS
jgi:carboxylate-amine ligase